MNWSCSGWRVLVTTRGAMTFCAALVACHTPARPNVTISSEHSDYSPVVRIRGEIAARRDSVIVSIDSGWVGVPGVKQPGAPPVMRDLFLTMLIATANNEPSSVAMTPQAPWRVAAEGDSIALPGEWKPGEVRPLPARSIGVRLPAGLDLGRSWIAVRIAGAAMTSPVRLNNGSIVPPRAVSDGVRVFACFERSLRGQLDSARARAMAETYTSAC